MSATPFIPYHPKVNLKDLSLDTVDFAAENLQNVILDLRALIERGHAYSYLAAAVLTEHLRGETFATQGHEPVPRRGGCESQKPYPTLHQYVEFGIEQGHLSPRLREFDLDFLEGSLKHERNFLFDYLGAHTLYDRYLLHTKGHRYESFQHFWMRVAMGVALAEERPDEANTRAKDFYDAISQMFYVPSTPTLFNAGTTHPQMSSCFLTTTQDDLLDIYRQYSDNAMLSKFAGGLGNDWTNIRGGGSWIKGTNGRSQGVIPFLKVQDSSTVAVNQGGKRKGAVCAYLEFWHVDIEDFLELRKNTGDDRRRTHDMNIAAWVPDLFMERMENDQPWTLFCPSEAPELHETYGETFKAHYLKYEALAAAGKMGNSRQVPALQLWRKLLTMLFETGHPWVTFKDPCNLRNPQGHVGTVHSSNLCTEITLNTSKDETAVCNLGSLNLKAIFKTPRPAETMAQTIKVALRMLDNVITETFYPIESAKTANKRHRPVGLGMMGFQDVLHMKRVSYTKPEAIYLSEKLAEFVSYHAIETSALLARERGSYETFAGSLWSQGQVTHDTVKNLGKHVQSPEVPTTYTNKEGKNVPCFDLLQGDGFSPSLDWDHLRSLVKGGMRNSLCLAIAPTATISNISNCTQSIEPTYKNLYVKSNMGGDYTLINEYLENDLRALGLWNDDLILALKHADGSLEPLVDLPLEIRELYLTAFDIDPKQLIRCASVRQKHIDQAQSLNLYMSSPSGKKLDEMYKYAWHCGLKTTYYLRTRAASAVEKSSITSPVAAGAAARSTAGTAATAAAAATAQACSIDDPTCEACQ